MVSECSSAWLERYVRDVEVGSSNLLTPTIKKKLPAFGRKFFYALSFRAYLLSVLSEPMSLAVTEISEYRQVHLLEEYEVCTLR